jgi:M61 glycyl aminopeptidase
MLRFLLKTPSAVALVCALFSVRADLLYSCQSSEHPTVAARSMIPNTKMTAAVSPSFRSKSDPKLQFYKISLDFKEPLRASVQAVLAVPDGLLFTAGHAGGYEWSNFIKNIRATREDGIAVPIHSLKPGQWEIQSSKDETLSLTYDVDLSFTKEMREGSQRGGQFFGNSLYIVNRALFVMSNAASQRHVDFVLPSSFQIATPWRAATPSGYQAQDNSELADNFTVIGSFPSFQIAEGDFRGNFTLATGKTSISEVSAWYIPAYRRIAKM